MTEGMTPGITRVPDVRGGRPCIEGNGIRVTDIVTAVQLEYGAEEIADDLDLSLEQVNAALIYYEQNRDAFDADMKRQDDNFEKHFRIGYGRPQTPVLPQWVDAYRHP